MLVHHRNQLRAKVSRTERTTAPTINPLTARPASASPQESATTSMPPRVVKAYPDDWRVVPIIEYTGEFS